MRSTPVIAATCAFVMSLIPYALARTSRGSASQAQAETVSDPAKILVERLDLERYKATIKGLTQFGDRRQGTDRNRAAIDWIEAQLKSYGCTNTERLTYNFQPPPDLRNTVANTAAGPGTPHAGRGRLPSGGGRPRGLRVRTGVNTDPMKQPDAKLRALNTQPSHAGLAGGGLLHQGRDHASRRDVHRRRAHGRTSAGAKPPTTTDRARRW